MVLFHVHLETGLLCVHWMIGSVAEELGPVVLGFVVIPTVLAFKEVIGEITIRKSADVWL